MSSPSPDIQKGGGLVVEEHVYQSSESISDHGLHSHPHPQQQQQHVLTSCCQSCTNEKLVPGLLEQTHQTNKTEPTTAAPPHHHPHHQHCLSSPQLLLKSNHQQQPHNVINLSHVPPNTISNAASHIHHPISQSVHVHVHASPKTGHAPKIISTTTCTCHLQDDTDPGIESDPGMLQSSSRKLEADDRIEVSPLPPALPPRPPPRPRIDGSLNSRHRPRIANPNHGGLRKYVICCCICGSLATILGALFLAVYFLLRSYTSTLGYFETIPTFVPATMLILTGLCVTSLARRKNRYSYLIKICGLCCLVCALTCVLVTITTTVIHMNRLQTLRECVYTQKTRTCTCYSKLLESHSSTEEGITFVFDSTPDCGVIHGALYSCLRAMFGLSVSGILVCIFSCMLVYQLLSHERKKMYWEQLELRCRSFYQQHTSGAGGGTGGPHSTHGGSVRGPSIAPSTYCSCCEECRYPPLPIGPQVYPWDTHNPTDRFWTPGRVGNFYSPNPGEDGPQVGVESANRDRASSGWSWRRLPWTRGNNGQNESQRDNSLTYQVGTSSADSQYGFSNSRSGAPGENMIQCDPNTGSTGSYSVLDNRPPVGGVYVWGPPPPYSNPNSPARRPVQSPVRYHHIHHHVHGAHHESHCQMNTTSSSEAADHGHHPGSGGPQFRGNSRNNRPLPSRFHHHNPPSGGNKDNYENTFENTSAIETGHLPKQLNEMLNNGGESSTDSSSCVDNNGRMSSHHHHHHHHTLPVRKMKKKSVDMMMASSVKAASQQGGGAGGGVGGGNLTTNGSRTNVQNIFLNSGEESKMEEEHDYHEPMVPPDKCTNKSKNDHQQQQCRFLPRLQGVENAAFQKQETSPQKPETSESEVYFADVSSCCNISVRNDGQDSSLYDEALETSQKPRLMSLQKPASTEISKDHRDSAIVGANDIMAAQNFPQHDKNNMTSSSTVTDEEEDDDGREEEEDGEEAVDDYLAHRIGNRQMSVRSRMPFPLPCSEDLGELVGVSNGNNANSLTASCLQLLPKDVSQNSLCSGVQTPMTETTDDGLTPVDCRTNYFQDNTVDQHQQKNRNFSSNNMTDVHFLAPDAQYEVIHQEQQNEFGTGSNSSRQNASNLTTTISGLNNFGQNYYGSQQQQSNTKSHNNFPSYDSSMSSSPMNIVPPKTLNLNQQQQIMPNSRRNIGSNISALIQNLGGNPVGLLYGEASNSADEEEVQGQACHSDGTMDSGWHSGCEKTTDNKKQDGGEPVDV